MNTPFLPDRTATVDSAQRHTLLRLFTHSIHWNTISTVIYHAVYVIHQSFLYAVLPTEQYGLIGSLLAHCYLGVALTNGGLNESLGPLFRYACTSRTHFIRLVVMQLFAVAVFAFVGAYVVLFWFFHANNVLSTYAFWSLCAIFVVESIRKPLTYLMQLFFATQSAALIEIGTIIFYVAFVWSCFYWYSLYDTLLFFPLALVLFVAVILLGLSVYYQYKKLPKYSVHPLSYTIFRAAAMNRLFNWFNQLGRAFCSINGLITLVAVRYGLQTAGNVTFVCSLLYALLAMSRKAFGMSAFALFAQLINRSTNQKNASFIQAKTVINRSLYIFLALLILGLAVTSIFFAYSQMQCATLIILAALVYIESWLSVYESLYLNESRPYYIGLANGGTALGIYYVAYAHTIFTTRPVSLLELLGVLIVLRLVALGVLIVRSRSFWQTT